MDHQMNIICHYIEHYLYNELHPLCITYFGGYTVSDDAEVKMRNINEPVAVMVQKIMVLHGLSDA